MNIVSSNISLLKKKISQKNKFHQIVVVAGGWSDEREISLMSGKNVYSCLRKNKFNVKFFNLKK